jgi:ATP-dependent DNA helicase PIF1
LHEPLRQAQDPNFAEFLDSIGDNYNNEHVDLGRLNHTQSIEDVIEFVFPSDILSNAETCLERAILSPFNEFVDEFNDAILQRVPGEARTYLSSDSIEDDNAVGDNPRRPLATPDYLNSLREPGIPPHDLTIKVGSICRFTRNFSAAKGITKNTRVIVRQLLRHSVEVSTLPLKIGRRTLPSVCQKTTWAHECYSHMDIQITLHVPRIDFKFSPSKIPFEVTRRQIPLVLCYATTFNGCQGLTVKKLALDLRRPVFSHGQLYSAMTRVPDARSVVILKSDGESDTRTRNIVWQELLLDT